MVYSKNATKTNVSQPNIQMSMALECCQRLVGDIISLYVLVNIRLRNALSENTFLSRTKREAFPTEK